MNNKMNCCFPRIPMQILFLDSLKGKRKQLYVDGNGEHQYYKELGLIRKIQRYVDDEKDTLRRKDPDFCRVKFNNRMHKECMYLFGYSIVCTDFNFNLMEFQNED